MKAWQLLLDWLTPAETLNWHVEQNERMTSHFQDTSHIISLLISGSTLTMAYFRICATAPSEAQHCVATLTEASWSLFFLRHAMQTNGMNEKIKEIWMRNEMIYPTANHSEISPSMPLQSLHISTGTCSWSPPLRGAGRADSSGSTSDRRLDAGGFAPSLSKGNDKWNDHIVTAYYCILLHITASLYNVADKNHSIWSESGRPAWLIVHTAHSFSTCS